VRCFLGHCYEPRPRRAWRDTSGRWRPTTMACEVRAYRRSLGPDAPAQCRLELAAVGRGVEHGGAARARAPGAPGLAHADVRGCIAGAALRLAVRTALETREQPRQKTAASTVRPARHTSTVHRRVLSSQRAVSFIVKARVRAACPACLAQTTRRHRGEERVDFPATLYRHGPSMQRVWATQQAAPHSHLATKASR
jgi:hypothetical protein